MLDMHKDNAIEIYKFATKLQTRLLKWKIYVGLILHHGDSEFTLSFKRGDKHDSVYWVKDSSRVLSVARAIKHLLEDKYLPITEACSSLIGQELWYEKTEPIIVASVISSQAGTIITCTKGKHIPQEKLYIKV